MRTTRFGKYTAVDGKLAAGDYREAYVTGPTQDGRIAPLASCWSFDDAERLARRMHKKSLEAQPERAAEAKGETLAGARVVCEACGKAHTVRDSAPSGALQYVKCHGESHLVGVSWRSDR